MCIYNQIIEYLSTLDESLRGGGGGAQLKVVEIEPMYVRYLSEEFKEINVWEYKIEIITSEVGWS